MKLIVTGATGLVGTEIIKQSLRIPEITSVIALARHPVEIQDESGVDAAKFKSVVIRDYGEYTDEVKAEFAGADACIWTVAVTPLRSRSLDFAEVKRVCQTCTLAGFQAIYEAGPARPFRFVYLSAEGITADLAKKPRVMDTYMLMRGETERMVLELPKQHKDVEVCIAHPGLITSSTTWARAALACAISVTNAVTFGVWSDKVVELSQVAAAVLEQAVHGRDEQMLSNRDLIRIGTAALKSR